MLSMNLVDLTNKTTLITGGSRGIGLAIARRILDLGGQVCLTGRNQPGLVEPEQPKQLTPPPLLF